MLDDSISLVNELAKVKVALESGGGGAGAVNNQSLGVFARAVTDVTPLTVTQRPTENGSQSYVRAFNHGGGQFAIAAHSYNDTGSSLAVRPFTVNQTTGAINIGSLGTFWNSGANGSSSTVSYGEAGNYGFFSGYPYPNGTRAYTVAAWTVQNNSITGQTYQTFGTNYRATANENSATTRSGSTGYFYPHVYDANNGQAYQFVFTYNGSSLNTQISQSLGSNTSTQYLADVVPQFGSTSATQGSLRVWQNNNTFGQISVLDSGLQVVNTYSQVSLLGYPHSADMRIMGFELSNGRQIHYLDDGSILLRNGSTLTNITSTADYPPFFRHSTFNGITPVSQNTWIAYSERSPHEMIKFSINPTTYKIEVVGSFLVGNFSNSGMLDSNARYAGAFITGNNNQFVVLVSCHESIAQFSILVGDNPLKGA